MRRRDFVRALIPVSFAPRLLFGQKAEVRPMPAPAPVPWTRGLNADTPIPQTAVADTVAETEAQFFTEQQMATLVRLSDTLLPPIGDKPGALEAGTPQFLDFLIGSSPADRRAMYTGGLDWLDAAAQKKYNAPFAKLNDQQAGELLKPWLRTWMTNHPPAEPHADFINVAHDDIRTATVNSKAWSSVPSVGAQEATEAGLFWSPIEPDIYGESAECARTQAHLLASPKTPNSMPIYPR